VTAPTSSATHEAPMKAPVGRCAALFLVAMPPILLD
jgi:hypothetical protein